MISLEVREAFPAFTRQFEGYINWMYLDRKGLVTCGVGDLIDPYSAQVGILPWLRQGGEQAHPLEILSDWSRVKAMKPGMLAAYYRTPGALVLTDAAVDELVLTHLDSDVELLTTHFFPTLGNMPTQVQMAICSMAWAMGAGFPVDYPKFTAAVHAQDWVLAGIECDIPELGEAQNGRNAANKALFMKVT